MQTFQKIISATQYEFNNNLTEFQEFSICLALIEYITIAPILLFSFAKSVFPTVLAMKLKSQCQMNVHANKAHCFVKNQSTITKSSHESAFLWKFTFELLDIIFTCKIFTYVTYLRNQALMSRRQEQQRDEFIKLLQHFWGVMAPAYGKATLAFLEQSSIFMAKNSGMRKCMYACMCVVSSGEKVCNFLQVLKGSVAETWQIPTALEVRRRKLFLGLELIPCEEVKSFC